MGAPALPTEGGGPASRPRLWAGRIALAASVAAALLVAYLTAREQAVPLPTFHLDGAFQTASGEFRLRSGELPGRDFFPYLGAGPVYAIFPMFALLGGTLGAAVTSAYFVTTVIVTALALTLARFIGRIRSPLGLALVALGAVCVIAFLPRMLPPQLDVMQPVIESLGPGNSLRPVRAASPLLMVLALTCTWRLQRVPLRSMFPGLCCGTVLAVWSNDFALVPSVLFVIATGYLWWRSSRLSIRALGWYLLGVGIGFGGVGELATGFHLTDYLAYNYSDVFGDQFWYFGAWGPGQRVYGVGDLVQDLVSLGALPGLLVLVVVSIAAIARPSLASVCVAFLGWAPLAGGTVALVGGHFDDYFVPFRLWTLLVLVFGAVLLLHVAVVRLRRTRRPAPPRLGTALVLGLAAVVVIASALVSLQITTRYSMLRQYLATDTTDWQARPALGGYLPTAWSGHVDRRSRASGPIIEEYAGLWMATTRTNPPLTVDAIIHALGRQRAPFARYVSTRVRTAVTTAPQLSAMWVSWNLSENWWFYRPLFMRFAPVQDSPSTIVWTRVPGPTATPRAGACTVARDHRSITIVPAAKGVNEVTVRYRGPGRGSRAYSMLDNGIDRALDADGAVALDPGAHSQVVPVFAGDRSARRLPLRDTPHTGQTVITACSVRTVPLASERTEPLFDGVLTGRAFGTP